MAFVEAEPGWSEWTPGTDWRSYCSKKHWEMDGSVDAAEYRYNLMMAEECKEFEKHDHCQ